MGEEERRRSRGGGSPSWRKRRRERGAGSADEVNCARPGCLREEQLLGVTAQNGGLPLLSVSASARMQGVVDLRDSGYTRRVSSYATLQATEHERALYVR